MLCLPQKPLSLAEAWSQPNARDTILRQAVCPRPLSPPFVCLSCSWVRVPPGPPRGAWCRWPCNSVTIVEFKGHSSPGCLCHCKRAQKGGHAAYSRGWLSNGAESGVGWVTGDSTGVPLAPPSRLGVHRACEAGAGPGPGAPGSSHWASVTPVCICSLGLSYQDATDWGLPQQECICSHFWRLGVQDQHMGGFGLSWGRSSLCILRWCFFCMPPVAPFLLCPNVFLWGHEALWWPRFN